MIRSTKALGIDLVDVFGAGWARRKPSTLRHYFQAADGCIVARSLGENGLEFFASQLRRPYLLW